MERKPKLLATSSSEARGAGCNGVFRLFSLPEGVSHHILSFLPIKDLTRFGLGSKRCREFQMSTPSLNFEGLSHHSNTKHFRLMSSLDRFLVHRGDNKIGCFRIHWDLAFGKTASFQKELYRVLTWVYIAVKCKVQMLDMKLRMDPDTTTLELPSCVFSCETLKSLLVECNKILATPTVACSTNLQYLKLRKVTIGDGFCKWISFSCKCLKELHFEEVEVDDITIESFSLESFSFVFPYDCHLHQLKISSEKLEAMYIEWRCHLPSSTSFTVSAPNLKSLKWIGNLLDHQNLGNLMHLEKAEIFLSPASYEYNFDNAIKVLHRISKVKVLILCEDTAKAMFKEGQSPAQFDDISYLGMNVKGLDDDVVPAMVYLMRGMPNLSTLNLKSNHSIIVQNPDECRFDRTFWKSQNLSFISELKEVTIELSSGNIELELARYILEDAENLQKMVIIFSPQQLNLIKEMKESKRHSAAKILFQEKNKRK